MTWKSLMDLFAYEFRRLRGMPVVSFGFSSQPVLNPEELKAEEARCAERLDLIVRDFARTRRWPSIDEKERYFLRERLRFAYEYASIAEISVKNPRSIATRPHLYNEQRRLVEWLLIDVWREAGLGNWLEPFYVMAETGQVRESNWNLHVSE